MSEMYSNWILFSHCLPDRASTSHEKRTICRNLHKEKADVESQKPPETTHNYHKRNEKGKIK